MSAYGHSGEHTRDRRRLALNAKQRRAEDRAASAAMRRAPARASSTHSCRVELHELCGAPWCECPCHTEPSGVAA